MFKAAAIPEIHQEAPPRRAAQRASGVAAMAPMLEEEEVAGGGAEEVVDGGSPRPLAAAVAEVATAVGAKRASAAKVVERAGTAAA